MSKDRAFKVMTKAQARAFAKGWHFKLTGLILSLPQLPIPVRNQNLITDAVMLAQKRLSKVYSMSVEYAECPTCKGQAERYVLDGEQWAECKNSQCNMRWFKVEPEPKGKKVKRA